MAADENDAGRDRKISPTIRVIYGHAWFWFSERKRLRELEETISIVKANHQKVTDRGMEHFGRIYNVALFTMILEYDFAVLKYEAFVSIKRWRRHFVARQLALLLYEASDDLPTLLGKDFRKSLEFIGVTEEELTDLNAIGKSLNDFKKKHNVGLKKVRDITAAHRDHNAPELLKVIQETDPLDLLNIAGDYYVAIRNLIMFLTKTISRLGDWKVIIKHIDFDKIPNK